MRPIRAASASCFWCIGRFFLPRISAATDRSTPTSCFEGQLLTCSFAASSFLITYRAARRPLDPLRHKLAAQLYKMRSSSLPRPPAYREEQLVADIENQLYRPSNQEAEHGKP